MLECQRSSGYAPQRWQRLCVGGLAAVMRQGGWTGQRSCAPTLAAVMRRRPGSGYAPGGIDGAAVMPEELLECPEVHLECEAEHLDWEEEHFASREEFLEWPEE